VSAGADPASVVDRYLALIGDHGSAAGELAALLHGDFHFVERPNLVSPHGSERDRDDVVRSLLAGRELLAAQRFEVRDHLVSADRVVTRAAWTGTVARDAGPFRAGTELRAESSMHFVVRDGLIVEQENFDCFHPFGP
jgi:ketosteroid isomerase-like protein